MMYNKKRHPGFFLFVDMLISLLIITLCVMTVGKAFEKIYFLDHAIGEVAAQRNKITEIITSKYSFVENNDLQKDRSYQIFDDMYVNIYHIELDETMQKRTGLEQVEFGLIEERKGEQLDENH